MTNQKPENIGHIDQSLTAGTDNGVICLPIKRQHKQAK